MTTISIEELFLVTLVLVDDWYTQKGRYLLKRRVGTKPTFRDSEMLTLMLAIDFFEFSTERRYHAFVQANYLGLFPHLLDQSQYNRRARSLRFLLNALRQDWANELGVQWEKHFCWTRPLFPLWAIGAIKAIVTSAVQQIMATVLPGV
jgi:hypothetical protein